MNAVILIALFATAAVAQNDYNFQLFQDQIDYKCLSRLWTNYNGQRDMRPSGQTLESFISMVEKVEGNHTDWDIYQVSRAILKRFAFEGIIYKDLGNERTAVQSDEAMNRWKVTKELLGVDNQDITFDEQNLNEEEKCTMFFMMGHLVNNTFREGFDDDAFMSNEIPLDNGGPVFRSPPVKKSKHPREQGVVNVHGSRLQAVAIANVLNAILAGKNDVEPLIHELYHIKLDKFPTDRRIRPLIGVTLGEVLTRAAHGNGQVNQGVRFFGPGGVWNSTLCPTEYTLKENVTGATTALLRGAVDGLLIGKAVKEFLSDVPNLRLSRVLRMYYSRAGINRLNTQEKGYSYCRRQEVMGTVGPQEIQESVLAYYYVYRAIGLGQVNQKTEEVVNNAISQMNAALASLSDDDTATEECKRKEPTPELPTCETPSNVFVILDSSDRQTDGYAQQEDVVGMLASRLDFGVGSGSLSVFHTTINNNELQAVSYNSTNPTCATCKTAWIDQRNLKNPDSEVQILDGLNKTLQNFETKTDLLPGVPNKVVVLFHFDDVKETNKNRLKSAGNMLREGHRDTRILAVGKNKDGLSPMVSGDANVITDISNSDVLSKELASRICKVPAIFQFNRCYDHSKKSRNEDKNVYTGYVTDNHVQFWAFYPEYFLKSYTIKIKFQAETGDIVVCEQRGLDNPGFHNGVLQRDRCKKTDGSSREITFTFSNPCETYHVHNCPSINFAIIGDSKNLRQYGCPEGDSKCRRLDQVKFQVSHDGISCSGCEFLKSSPVVLLAFFIVFLIKNIN